MANFRKTSGNDYPTVEPSQLNENDPMIVKVPMECTDWGARRPAMNKAKSPESGGNGRLGIKHIDSKK